MAKKTTIKSIIQPRSTEQIYDDMKRRIKARKAYEAQVEKELEWGSGYVKTNDEWRQGTRLDRSRILQSDEDA